MKALFLFALIGFISFDVCAVNKGLAVELLVGKTKQKIKATAPSSYLPYQYNFIDTSGSDDTVGIRAGYSIQNNVMFELSYNSHGIADGSSLSGSTTSKLESSINSTQLGLKGHVPLVNGISLNGRIGLSLWDIEVQETTTILQPPFGSTRRVGDDSGTDIYYGVGLQYQVNKSAFLAMQYILSECDAKFSGGLAGGDAKVALSVMAISMGISF